MVGIYTMWPSVLKCPGLGFFFPPFPCFTHVVRLSLVLLIDGCRWMQATGMAIWSSLFSPTPPPPPHSHTPRNEISGSITTITAFCQAWGGGEARENGSIRARKRAAPPLPFPLHPSAKRKAMLSSFPFQIPSKKMWWPHCYISSPLIAPSVVLPWSCMLIGYPVSLPRMADALQRRAVRDSPQNKLVTHELEDIWPQLCQSSHFQPNLNVCTPFTKDLLE